MINLAAPCAICGKNIKDFVFDLEVLVEDKITQICALLVHQLMQLILILFVTLFKSGYQAHLGGLKPYKFVAVLEAPSNARGLALAAKLQELGPCSHPLEAKYLEWGICRRASSSH